MPIHVPVAVLEAFVLAHKERVLQLLEADDQSTPVSPPYLKFDCIDDKNETFSCSNAKKDEFKFHNPVISVEHNCEHREDRRSPSHKNSDTIIGFMNDAEENYGRDSNVQNADFDGLNLSNSYKGYRPLENSDSRNLVNTSNSTKRPPPPSLKFESSDGFKTSNSMPSSPPSSIASNHQSGSYGVWPNLEIKYSTSHSDGSSSRNYVDEDGLIEIISLANNAKDGHDLRKSQLLNSSQPASNNTSPMNATSSPIANNSRIVSRTRSGAFPGTYQLTNLQDWNLTRPNLKSNISASMSMGSLKDFINRCGPLINNSKSTRNSSSDLQPRSIKRPDYIPLNIPQARNKSSLSTSITIPRSTSMPASSISSANALPPQINPTPTNNRITNQSNVQST